MAILSPPSVNTRELTWIKDESMFVAEDSSLPSFGRVWDDACDVGLTLVSHMTGKALVCAVEHYEVKDGDLVWWDLQPIDPRFHNSFVLRVYND